MPKEKVKLNDGTEVEIDCKHITGRKAFQLGPEILKIHSIKQAKDGSFEAGCTMNSAVDICWPEIVAQSPQSENVTVEDMQKIYEKYAQKDIDFVVKKNMENLGTGKNTK
jgi:hypothetical protein